MKLVKMKTIYGWNSNVITQGENVCYAFFRLGDETYFSTILINIL